MSAPIAIWNWEREPQPPSARVVVCRPGVYDDHKTARMDWLSEQASNAMSATSSGPWIVACRARPPMVWPRHIIPALYAERQADLAGVGDLLTVQAERRALVLCPREAMDLHDALDFFEVSGPAGTVRAPCIDLVVIIPPPEARTCGGCDGTGIPPGKPHFAMLRCPVCSGSGRIEPWPTHPAWVRSIVEQCREVGALVADLTSDAPSALPEWLT